MQLLFRIIPSGETGAAFPLEPTRDARARPAAPVKAGRQAARRAALTGAGKGAQDYTGAAWKSIFFDRAMQVTRRNRREATSAARSFRSAEYRSAIVSFIDVLGFRELIRTATANDILTIVRLTQRFAAANDTSIVKEAGMTSDMNWTRTFAFSDSIVRVRPYDAEYNEGSLFHEILSLVHAQGDLANRGIFIRGGLTVGSVVFEDKAVFGPGFVRAYDLESQYANTPRIVIGPEVFRELRTNPKLRAEHHELHHEVRYIRDLLRRGEDGLWFIDYLRAVYTELDDPGCYPDFLKRHRMFIINQATKLPLESKALQKYLWLAEYHNKVCREWLGSADVGELEISGNDVQAFEALSDGLETQQLNFLTKSKSPVRRKGVRRQNMPR